MSTTPAITPSDAVRRVVDDAEQIVDITSRIDLSGRRIVVLGGGRGMGRHTSHALAQLGARVIVVDNDQERADVVATEIGGHAEGRAVDATSDEQMAALAEDLTDIDAVVDIIGVARYSSLVSTSVEDWDWEHEIVLRHAWLAVRHFGPTLAGRGAGSLTFVASVSGVISSPWHGAYGVFKAGLISLVRTAAVELGPDGVRVNAVAPGFVVTPRMGDFLDDAGLERSRATAPLPHLTTPSDVAAVLTFLVSDLASAVTGQTVVVDAGATSNYPYDMSTIAQGARA